MRVEQRLSARQLHRAQPERPRLSSDLLECVDRQKVARRAVGPLELRRYLRDSRLLKSDGRLYWRPTPEEVARDARI